MKKRDAAAERRAETGDQVQPGTARIVTAVPGSGPVRNGVPLMPRRPAGSARPTLALVNKLRDGR